MAPRVFIIDDDETLIRLLKEFLSDFGFQV
jgi:DNA-binding response OmpR family regulator